MHKLNALGLRRKVTCNKRLGSKRASAARSRIDNDQCVGMHKMSRSKNRPNSCQAEYLMSWFGSVGE